MIPQSLVTSQFCRNKYQFSTHMNGVFDVTDYGEIYLYQYANSCPGTGQYRGSVKGFPSNTKVEVRHTCCDPYGYWYYYMKGSGIWLDLGKTLAFTEHYEAFKYLIPDYVLVNGRQDTLALKNAMRKKSIATIQFLANNEYNARYKDEKLSCPSTTKHIFQYASKPYTCSCVNNLCLNCKINNYQFQGQFPPCVSCDRNKFNTECLSSCPSGTIEKKAYYADEEYICLQKPCNQNTCQECSSSGNECIKCYDGYVIQNGECVKKLVAIKLLSIVCLQILILLQI